MLIREPAALAEALPDGALVFGTAVRAYPGVLGEGRFRVGERELEVGRAAEVARLGERRITCGQQVSPLQLVPRYYRLTEPEEKLGTTP